MPQEEDVARLTVHAELLSDYKMAFEAVQWVKTAQVNKAGAPLPCSCNVHNAAALTFGAV